MLATMLFPRVYPISVVAGMSIQTAAVATGGCLSDVPNARFPILVYQELLTDGERCFTIILLF
jgi:hypothetical protein